MSLSYLIRKVALRHLVRAPGRTLVSVFGTAIAVAGMVSIISANRAVLDSFRGTLEHLSGKVDVEVGSGDAPIVEELLEPLSRVRGVAHISPVIQARARHVKSGEVVLILGIDLTGDSYFREYEGTDGELDPLEFLNCVRCLLLPESFARRVGVRRGETLPLVTPDGLVEFQIKDVLRDDGPARASGGAMGVMYLDAAQLVFKRVGRYDRIDIAIDREADREKVEAEIRSVVGPSISVERPERRGERTEDMMIRFQAAMKLVSVLALLVSMFMIYNTVGIAVAQRRREIGMLRALGVTRREIRWLFVGEAVTLGLLGSFVGVLGGGLLASGVLRAIGTTVTSLYVSVDVSRASVDPPVAILAVLICVGSTAVAAFLPTREAAAVAPALSMQKSEGTNSLPVLHWKAGTVAAVVLYAVSFALTRMRDDGPVPWGGQLAMGLVLAAGAALAPLTLKIVAQVARRPLGRLFGPPGVLAADNLSRQGPRAVVTVAALLVGIALALGSATFVNGFHESIREWMEQTVPADLFVTSAAPVASGKNIRMPRNLREPLLKIAQESVGGQVECVVIRKHNFENLRITVLGVEPDIRLAHATFKVVDGALPADPTVMQRERVVFASENLAYRKHLHAGESVVLDTPSGSHSYRIAAVYVDYTSDQGTIMMDQRLYATDFADETVDAFEFYVASTAGLDNLVTALRQGYGEKYDLYFLTSREFRGAIQNIVDESFMATNSMSVMAVIVALLGVVNTLLAAVLDRTRELGVLRAIGMSRTQIVLSFMAEALLLAICAAVLGAIAGAFLGLLFVEVVNLRGTGWHIGFYPPYAYQSFVVGMALVAAALAATGPAWRAARQQITTALAYE